MRYMSECDRQLAEIVDYIDNAVDKGERPWHALRQVREQIDGLILTVDDSQAPA